MRSDLTTGNHRAIIYADTAVSDEIHSSLRELKVQCSTVRNLNNLGLMLRNNNFDLIIYHDRRLSLDLNESQFDTINYTEQSIRSLLIIEPTCSFSGQYSWLSNFDELIRYPFESEILQIRVSNLLGIKRKESDLIGNDIVQLDLSKKKLLIRGTVIEVDKFESVLIKSLFYSRSFLDPTQIMQILMRENGRYYSPNYLRVKIHRLRRKIETQSGMKLIKNRRGEGYYLSF